MLMVEFEIVLGMDTKVIHVNFEPLFSDHVHKNMVHESLEGRWSITEAKEHHGQFIEAKRGDECCLPLVVFLDTDVVVTPMDIELGEYRGFLHIVN